MAIRGKLLTFVSTAFIALVGISTITTAQDDALSVTKTDRPATAAYQQNTAAQTTSPTTYRLEADVSMRSIPVDIRFSGAQIVMFGSANRIGPPTVNAGPLDVVAVVQGARSRMTVRRKSKVWGIWINTQSVDFEQAPRYYTVASTRPLESIAPTNVLAENGIGIEQVAISTALGEAAGLRPTLLNEFRDAAIGLGIRQKQYKREDGGVTFIGSSLFRGQINLPASISVGTLDVSVFLFRGGEVVARTDSRVTLSREGFEHFIYQFANNYALLYGFCTVALAVVIGLFSSFIVSLRRQ